MGWSSRFVAVLIAVALGPVVGGAAFAQDAAEPPSDTFDAAGPPPEPADAGPGTITLELNKLVPAENACQAYLVVDNGSPEPLQELKVDVFLFDNDGVVLRGVALQFTDLRAGRTTVVPFDLTELACDDIGRVLLNEVVVCNADGGVPLEDCADKLAVRSRVDATFEY